MGIIIAIRNIICPPPFLSHIYCSSLFPNPIPYIQLPAPSNGGNLSPFLFPSLPPTLLPLSPLLLPTLLTASQLHGTFRPSTSYPATLLSLPLCLSGLTSLSAIRVVSLISLLLGSTTWVLYIGSQFGSGEEGGGRGTVIGTRFLPGP